MKSKIVIEVICFMFIVLFVYAGVTKIMDFQKFTVQIGQSPLLTAYGDLIPWMVPALEMIISVLLMFERFRLIALYASFSLMVMFTGYIVAILNFSSYVPCSCGGILEKLGWTEHLIFNSVFIGLAVLGIVLTSREGRDGSFEIVIQKTD